MMRSTQSLLLICLCFGRKCALVKALDPEEEPLVRGRRETSSVEAKSDVWIVELKRGVRSSSFVLPRSAGGSVGLVYDRILNGFVYHGSDIDVLKRDPNVKSITRDGIVTAFGGQILTNGVRRIGADKKKYMRLANQGCRCDAVVAIVDTGVDARHPDLNVNKAMSIDCTLGVGPQAKCVKGRATDVQGHGTHVAGSAAAISNRRGVIGVCPGAEIWSIKVLGDDGIGYNSWILAGLDHVLKNAKKVDVANLSLGGLGCDKLLCKAITKLTRAGVSVAAAAGNDGAIAAYYRPACCINALTVSALADADGKPGGEAFFTCNYELDDFMASFSNYGSAVDIMAPGDCILSTLPGGTYGYLSGTSMACPHVAGALAVLASNNHNAKPRKLYNQLINNGNYNYYSYIGYNEPLLDMSKLPNAKMVGKCG